MLEIFNVLKSDQVDIGSENLQGKLEISQPLWAAVSHLNYSH